MVVRTALSRLRDRYHPLYRLRRFRVFNLLALAADRRVFRRLPGIPWPVRLRLVRHLVHWLLPHTVEQGMGAGFRAVIEVASPGRFWDVGANFGWYGWLFLSRTPGGQVVLLEPPQPERGRRLFALLIESFGLAVLLLTSFIQSLRGGDEGLLNFVLLFVEAGAVIWWGAARRIKIPFFTGIGAAALNVVGQLVVLFLGGNTFRQFAIIGGLGLFILTVAVFVERQRSRI